MRRLLLAGVAVFALTANADANSKKENICAREGSAAIIIDSMNDALKERGEPFTVIDISGVTTLPLQIDETMSCHVTVELSMPGLKIPGTFKLRVNAAGHEVQEWRADAATPRRRISSHAHSGRKRHPAPNHAM